MRTVQPDGCSFERHLGPIGGSSHGLGGRSNIDRRAGARRACDESIATVANLALDKTHPQSSLFDFGRGSEQSARDRTHVLDLQIDSRKVLAAV